MLIRRSSFFRLSRVVPTRTDIQGVNFENVCFPIRRKWLSGSADTQRLKVTLSDDFVDILSKFYSAGSNQSHKARDILNVTQYTVWKKLMHWGVIESPKKGVGKITERGVKFLEGKIDLSETLYILNNEVKYQSHNRISTQ